KANIELRQLRYFVTVAQELNFTRAAEQLKIAQPPLSRQIQALEKALELQLFQRTNRRVTLTTAGEVFLGECQQILSQVDRSIQVAQRAAKGETGQLTIGFEGSFHNETVLSIIQSFRSQFPDVDLVLQEMSSGKQMDALLFRHIDVGFVDPIFRREEISIIQLPTEPLVVVLAASHLLAGQDSIDISQLEKASWITGQRDEGCGLLIRFLEACRQAGFTPNIRQETNDVQMRLGFVAAGLGITVLPISALISERSDIVYRELDISVPQVELAIAWQSNELSPVLQSFLGIVRSMF
ncbi:MAG: LysR substrate-binding domain-containing protein, partial [Cyanobacteria bacterium J06576_12]